ncbi:MAG: hypothetical protein ACT4P7_24055 [Gemmatimonadaceae bacterium]
MHRTFDQRRGGVWRRRSDVRVVHGVLPHEHGVLPDEHGVLTCGLAIVSRRIESVQRVAGVLMFRIGVVAGDRVIVTSRHGVVRSASAPGAARHGVVQSLRRSCPSRHAGVLLGNAIVKLRRAVLHPVIVVSRRRKAADGSGKGVEKSCSGPGRSCIGPGQSCIGLGGSCIGIVRAMRDVAGTSRPWPGGTGAVGATRALLTWASTI